VYCVGALVGGFMFSRWFRMGAEGRQRVSSWRLLGWFSALMTCANCFGAVCSVAQTLRYSSAIKSSAPDILASERSSLNELTYRWLAVVPAMFALEFLCLSVANLMILDRMSAFASPKTSGGSKWAVGARVVIVAVVACNAVGVAANMATTAVWKRSADFSKEASSYYAENNATAGSEMDARALNQSKLAYSLSSVYYYAEVITLLLIIATYCVVGVACARRVSITIRGVLKAGLAYFRARAIEAEVFEEAADQGRKLRLQILRTTAFVFLTFLLRCVYSSMRLAAHQLQDRDKECPPTPLRFCDDSCFNVYTLMQTWFLNTPEFQAIVVMITSPIALLVALRGMSSKIISQSEVYGSQLRSGAPMQVSIAVGSRRADSSHL
jgi:hypothetical protein